MSIIKNVKEALSDELPKKKEINKWRAFTNIDICDSVLDDVYNMLNDNSYSAFAKFDRDRYDDASYYVLKAKEELDKIKRNPIRI